MRMFPSVALVGAIISFSGVGCEDETAPLRAKIRQMREDLDQQRDRARQAEEALARARSQVGTLKPQLEECESQVELSDPAVLFEAAMRASDKGQTRVAEEKLGKFVELYPRHGNTRKARKLLREIQRERRADEIAAKLASISIGEIYRNITDYQAKAIDRRLSCYHPHTNSSSTAAAILMDNGYDLEEALTSYMRCSADGDSSAKLYVYFGESLLQELPVGEDRKISFKGRLRVSARDGSSLAVALEKIL